jgi:dihydroorotase
MKNIVIKNVSIVNEGATTTGDVWIRDTRIEKIGAQVDPSMRVEEIDGTGQTLIPGVIDDQVHFREPGLTHKATIYTEAKAAVRGGVTSFMEMPNTNPPAFTHELLEQKYDIAKNHALANYSFFMGTSNDNLEEILRTNDKKKDICGVKIFMGSSTGNLLVDNPILLEKIFEGSEVLIATHCEEERLIKQNLAIAAAENRKLTVADHPIIRDEEVCFESSFRAVQMAKKFGTRLHILHITTAKELQLFSNMLPLEEKRITSEVCVHHLHFTSDDYAKLGNQIKCNPAIKAPNNKAALWEGLLDNRLDIIATDHAPHDWKEKLGSYEEVKPGGPMIQHALTVLLEMYHNKMISLEKIVEKTSHQVAEVYRIKERGFIREGYFADLVMVDLNNPWKVTADNLLYKCQWSPLMDRTFRSKIKKVLVNGELAYEEGTFKSKPSGMRLTFSKTR